MSAAADEGPDEMTCFPAGLHFLLTFPKIIYKITQKSICLYANFSEKECLDLSVIYRHICERFQKGEFMDSVHISPRPSSATEIVGNCLPVSLKYHSSQTSSE